MSHILRGFKEDDSAAVKELILAILAKEYPFDKSAYSDSDLDRIGQTYGGQRDSFFVIEDGSRIVGTIGVKEETSDEALMRRLFVDEGYRKRGYGSELLKRAIAFSREKGYKRVYFRCTDRMISAMAICKGNGFREIEEINVGGFKIHKLVLML